MTGSRQVAGGREAHQSPLCQVSKPLAYCLFPLSAGVACAVAVEPPIDAWSRGVHLLTTNWPRVKLSKPSKLRYTGWRANLDRQHDVQTRCQVVWWSVVTAARLARSLDVSVLTAAAIHHNHSVTSRRQALPGVPVSEANGICNIDERKTRETGEY